MTGLSYIIALNCSCWSHWGLIVYCLQFCTELVLLSIIINNELNTEQNTLLLLVLPLQIYVVQHTTVNDSY